MLEFIYQSGWGAFTIMLLFQLPFLAVFLYVVFTKQSASDVDDAKINRVKGGWITIVIALFLVVNIASIKFIPAISTATAANSGIAVVDVDIEAQSWNYEMSAQDFAVGTPIRFNAKSLDTVHGFAVYHPDGRVLFTMMLVPGVATSSLIYTFKDPGTYKIRCLEYCGLAHHEMSDEIVITAAAS